jgi:4-hydroxymandelate oxidase
MDVSDARIHATSPPHRPGAAGGLWLDRVVHRAFDGDCEFLRAPHHRADIGTYLTDLLSPYGMDLDADRLAAGAGHSYGEMAADLIAAAVDDPVDVLVVAFAVPDVRPGRATATYLSHVCPGNPHAFAVCDQGAAAAFTGLLMLREYLGGGAGERGLLIVLEQSTLHYEPKDPAPVPAGNAGVALLCGRRPGRARVEAVRVHPDVGPEGVRALVERDAAAAATVIVGGVDAADLPAPTGHRGPTRRAIAGQPYTGVWSELAAILADGAGAGPVALVDYDPSLRYLGTAVIAL